MIDQTEQNPPPLKPRAAEYMVRILGRAAIWFCIRARDFYVKRLAARGVSGNELIDDPNVSKWQRRILAVQRVVDPLPTNDELAAEDRARYFRQLGRLIREQDNRATDCPIFIVQQRRRTYHVEVSESDGHVWVDIDDPENVIEPGEPEFSELEVSDNEFGSVPSNWEKVGFVDRWEFVTACFTEYGCQEYLRINGHNLNSPRIYAAGSYRNHEFRAVRDLLQSGDLFKPERKA